MNTTITEPEALEVLREVKAKLGRNYKAGIREAWMTGNYAGQRLADWDSKLQRIRNVFGPTWLVNARP